MKNSHPYTVRFLQFETRERETLEWLRSREAQRKQRRVRLRERLFGSGSGSDSDRRPCLQ